jgi:hypothetical protein
MSKKVKNKAAEITQVQSNKARRNLLLGGAAGVALGAWHKPVMKSVMLPAHAQTTDDTPPAPSSFFSGSAQVIVQNQTTPWTPLDIFVGPANAQRSEGPIEVQITPNATTEGSYDVVIQLSFLSNAAGEDPLVVFFESYEGTLTLDGGPGTVTSACGIDSQAQISNLDEVNRTIQLQFQMTPYLIPEGTGTLTPIEAC